MRSMIKVSIRLLVGVLLGAILLTACKKEEEKTNDVMSVSGGYQKNGIWYEIFVRAFADSDGDGIGDFRGIIDKLDYLKDTDESSQKDLGIDGIWLMPIHPSPSYHGYDVTDYYGVNPEYGTMEDFEELIVKAHERDIDVIIDLVLNHSSASHPWFKEAVNDPNSPYREYYRIVDGQAEGYDFTKQVWGHKVWNPIGDDYYYGIFWDQMPDLNYDSEALRNEMLKVAKFWLDKGVDGFRIDAVSHLYGSGELPKGESYEKAWEFWETFDKELRALKPDYYLVGEAWEDIEQRAKYNSYFDTTFNFDLADPGILAMVKNKVDLGNKNDGLNNTLSANLEKQAIYAALSPDGKFIDAPFLSNHDMDRAMEYLNGDLENMKLAARIYMTLPGNPFIYYGEEIGMGGEKPDENIREPFIWGTEDPYQTKWKNLDYNQETLSVKEQEEDPESLLSFYKELIRIRKEYPALLMGDFLSLPTQDLRLFAYERRVEGQRILVIHNLNQKEAVLRFDELGATFQETDCIYMSHSIQWTAEEIQLSAKSSVMVLLP